MRRLAGAIVVMFGLAVFGSVVSLVPQRPAAGAGSAPVNITSPLPLPVTGSVSAAVTGTVAAQQSGNWNVGITGAPNVNVANTSAIPVSGSVSVANTASNPVPTLNVNEPTAQPFVARLCLGSTPSECGGAPGSLTNVFTVPSTTTSGASVKRLVVEFVSGACVVPNGNQLTYVTLGGAGEQPPSHFFGLTYAPGSNQVETFGGQTKIYYDPGDTIGLSNAVLTLGSTYRCFGTISGYFATQ